MRVVRVIMTAAMGLAVSAPALFADPPEMVKAEWRVKASAMEVTVLHKVEDPAKHFVQKIEIMKNGKPLASKSYKRQKDNKQQVGRFVLKLKSGDELTIKATSNQGDDSKSIKYGID